MHINTTDTIYSLLMAQNMAQLDLTVLYKVFLQFTYGGDLTNAQLIAPHLAHPLCTSTPLAPSTICWWYRTLPSWTWQCCAGRLFLHFTYRGDLTSADLLSLHLGHFLCASTPLIPSNPCWCQRTWPSWTPHARRCFLLTYRGLTYAQFMSLHLVSPLSTSPRTLSKPGWWYRTSRTWLRWTP